MAAICRLWICCYVFIITFSVKTTLSFSRKVIPRARYILLCILSDKDLQQFHGEGTRLSGHPPVRGIPEIGFATGSLGHGLGLAAGVALGKRLQSQNGRTYCLTSDGEWNEGSCWESLIFLSHHSLDVTILVDNNGLQGFGATKDVSGLDSLHKRFRAFGVDTQEIDGHNFIAIETALRRAPNGPRVIVAKTVKGCGVSFMENRMEWHYLPMTKDQYLQAISEVTPQCATSSAAH